MPDPIYKVRVRRVRENVLIDLMVPMGRSGFKVVETINRGPVSLREAFAGLKDLDLSESPRLAAALIPEAT